MSSSTPYEATGRPVGNTTRYEYQTADLWRRLSAAVLDWFCIFLTSFVVGLILAPFNPEPGSGLANLAGIGVNVVYFWYFWTQKEGQTPGKHAMGIRVVRVDGTSITTFTALVRYVGYYVNTFLLSLGWIATLTNRERRGLHDYLAGTRVVMADAVITSVSSPVETRTPERAYSRVILTIIIVAGCALGYIVYYGPPSFLQSPSTITRGDVSITIPDGWRTSTDFIDAALCDTGFIECLFAAGPSSNLYFELVRYDFGIFISPPPTITDLDEELWTTFTQQNPQADVMSHGEVRVDGHRAIRRMFTDGTKTYLTLVIEENRSVLRLWAEGASSDFETYRDDLNTIIDSLAFTSDENE